jgi:hypothetical protein
MPIKLYIDNYPYDKAFTEVRDQHLITYNIIAMGINSNNFQRIFPAGKFICIMEYNVNGVDFNMFFYDPLINSPKASEILESFSSEIDKNLMLDAFNVISSDTYDSSDKYVLEFYDPEKSILN